MIRAIIVDDDEIAIEVVSKLCEKVEGVEVIERFTDALLAINYLNTNSVDLMFLDIHMPDLSGFDFIKSLNIPPKTILTTADKNFALDAFEYPCVVDYLVKPIALPRFIKSINKVSQQLSASKNNFNTSDYKSSEPTSNEIYVNIDRRLIKLRHEDINIIEARGDYILIKTDAKNYIVHSTMKKIESKLPSSMFMKVHRSYIVNIRKIIDIEDNSILIKDDVIPVSRSNKQTLIETLNLL